MSIKEQIDSIQIIDGHVHAVDPWYWLQYVGSFPFADVASKLPPLGPMQLLNKKKTTLRGFQEIFDFPHQELTQENLPEMERIYADSQKDEDEARYFMKAMDIAGIEGALEMCLSEPVLPPGIDASRFAKAQLVDGFLIPLDNGGIEGNKRVKEFVTMVEVYPKILRQKSDPKTFDAYLGFISNALEDLVKQDVVALKMNTAYWRDLVVDVVDRDEAEDVWNKKDTTPHRYKRLQDYLMRHLIAKAAELDLPIHIHTGSLGITRPIGSANPAVLDPFLWLPDIKAAKIVLLHGGYPFCREAGFMAGRAGDVPSCYLDFSMMTFFLPGSPDSIKNILKEWIEYGLADKLLYGSDGNSVLGMWMSAVNARHVLTLALDELIAEGFVDEGQAVNFATLILRGNVKKLYRIADGFLG